MSELFKDKKFIMFICCLIILLIASITLIILKNRNNYNQVNGYNKINNVEVSEVKKIYSILSNIDCEKVLIFDFNSKEIISSNELSNEFKFKLILSYLDANELLNESLTKKLFYKEASNILSDINESNLPLDTINYNGNEYIINENNTVITQNEECNKSNYKYKLFGYTYNENELSIDMAIVKTNGSNVYNLDDKLIGNYSNDVELNNLINNGTIYRYGFKLNSNNNYYFDNVSKVITIKLD